MKLTEKVSYIKGFIDALDVDKTSKEWQVINLMNDLLGEMSIYIDDLQNQVDELTELCENLDEDLGEVESEIFNIDEFNSDVQDDDSYLNSEFDEDDIEDELIYEAECPTCGRVIQLTEEMLEDGGVTCACGENLEFDYIDDEDDDYQSQDDDLPIDFNPLDDNQE